MDDSTENIGKVIIVTPEPHDEIAEQSMINGEHMVTIKKERYRELLRDSQFLNELMASGVENWEGYDEAVYNYEESDAFVSEDLDDEEFRFL